MDILRLQVKKLNGKYDFDINLDRRCTIIVGANGVGKTTILHIIEALNLWDFERLLQFSFDEIIYDIKVENEINQIVIRYEDLLPSPNVLANEIIKIEEALRDDINFSDEHREFIENGLIQLQKERILNQVMNSLWKGQSISYEIQAKMAEVGAFFALEKWSLSLGALYEEGLVNDIGIVYFRKAKLFDTIEQLKEVYRSKGIHLGRVVSYDTNKSYYFSMVSRINIVSSDNTRSFLHSDKLEWLMSYKGRHKISDELEIYNKLPKQWKALTKFINIGMALEGEDKLLDSYVHALRLIDDYEFIRAVIDKDTNVDFMRLNYMHSIIAGEHSQRRKNGIEQTELESLAQSSTININNLIARYYYNDEFQVSLNKGLIEYFADVLDGKEYIPSDDVRKEYLRKKGYDISYVRLIIDYVKPVFILPIDEPVGSIRMKQNGEWVEKGPIGDYYFYRYIDSVRDDLVGNEFVNPKILKIWSLLEKYYYNKKVRITPSGIKIYDERDDKFEQPLDFEALSSGEMKILILLIVATFGEEIKIYIDEPELSLSIAWQEEILQDIVDTGDCKIVVATHSPYMAGKDKLKDCVAYVPE